MTSVVCLNKVAVTMKVLQKSKKFNEVHGELFESDGSALLRFIEDKLLQVKREEPKYYPAWMEQSTGSTYVDLSKGYGYDFSKGSRILEEPLQIKEIESVNQVGFGYDVTFTDGSTCTYGRADLARKMEDYHSRKEVSLVGEDGVEIVGIISPEEPDKILIGEEILSLRKLVEQGRVIYRYVSMLTGYKYMTRRTQSGTSKTS